MKVYRVWGNDITNCAWLQAESEADAIDVVSAMKIISGSLTAALDDKKFNVPEGVVLASTGKTFDIIRGQRGCRVCTG